MDIIGLDRCVVDALEFLCETKLPSLRIPYRHSLVVGSGNAAVTGKILFEDKDAVFADESTYKKKLKAVKGIDGAILISASGGKHAPIIAKDLKKGGAKTVLLTCNPDAPAKRFVSKTFVFPKQTEPYTYNVSTYLGMILAKTRENPKKILNYVRKLKIPKNLNKYNAFFIIVPAEFDAVREMFLIKFSELFGPMINGRVFTPEQAKHAKTIVKSDKELFISLGYKNTVFGTKRLNIPLPKDADYGLMMALGYYIIGQIQRQHPQYFRNSIAKYCRETSKQFGEKIVPLVEA